MIKDITKKKCNDMDREYFLKHLFNCTRENYNENKCSEIQYLDQLKKDENSNEDYKIKFSNSSININVKEYYYIEKIWCKIGNYDIPILFIFLIIMVLFIILLIVDLCIDKTNLIIGIKYYIVLSLYMIYQFIFMIYIILILGLFMLSTLVSSYVPNTSNIDDSSPFNDPFFFPQNEDNTNSVIVFWKYKRIYAFIYCGINLILLIFIRILFNYYSLLFKYLSVDFAKDSNSSIIRKASIKIGKNNYDFEIIQNKNIYLKDRRENEKFYFKEILYDNNTIYLKFNNTGIKDQLSWIEYNYPIINYGFWNLFMCLQLLVLSYIFSIIILPIFHIKDDIFYKYFLHLYDLGYKPYLYDNLQKLGELQILFYSTIKYIFLVIGILILFPLIKWAFYGGFSNVIKIWIALFISIFINLIFLTFVILSFLLLVYSIINRITLERKIYFNYNLMSSKFMASIIFYLLISLFNAVLFAQSIAFSIFLYSVRKETKKLENDELVSENVFKVKTLNNENFIFQAINSENISKHLFYIKKRDENPILNNNDQSTNLFFEQSQEQLLDKNMLLELKNFKINYKNGLSGNILSIIIICLFSLAFIIAALTYSFKNYKYYKDFREYLIEKSILSSSKNKSNNHDEDTIERLGLPPFAQFWCDFGNIERNILISYFIFIILHICFQIIQYFIHKGIIKIDIRKGKSYKITIFMNSLFYTIFMIYFPLLLYLFLCSLIVSILYPFDLDSSILSEIIKYDIIIRYEKLWGERKLIPIISSSSFKLFIFINNCILSYRVQNLILHYLNLNFKNENDEKIKNEKYEKNTSVVINNNIYNVKIISNEILYLKEMKLGTIYKFKQILIENITNGYVYVKLGHNSITDQISLSEWHYPELNFIFSQLAALCKLIYAILFISIPLFKCLIKEEFNYILYVSANKIIKERGYNEKKPMFNDIFVYYGDFENGVIKSRFSLYFISIIFLLLFMLKRMLFGGFSSQIKSMISFIISLIFVALNIIFVILDFLMILFEIFSHIFISDNKINDSILKSKIYFQLSLNGSIFLINIGILVDSIKLSKNINDLRKELIKFNNVEEIEEKDDSINHNEFKYISIEGNIFHLKEVRSDKLQRYLYYSLDNDDKNNTNSEELFATKAVTTQNEDMFKNYNLNAETENRIIK